MSEKSPMASRKFLAYLVAEATWKIVLIVALYVFKDDLASASVWAWGFMTSTVIISGFVEAGYIGGQAWLDSYTQVADIAGRRSDND